MLIVIRADASSVMGSGHVMRCSALATALRASGADVRFVSRTLPGEHSHFLERCGFEVHRIESADEPADIAETKAILKQLRGVRWLVVDHYHLGLDWERAIRRCARLLAIDDLARSHDCDVLLDQNFYSNPQARYELSGGVGLFGPRYALLRPEFPAYRRTTQRHRDPRSVLVCFGGSDPTNETAKTLLALERLHHLRLRVEVVAGAANTRASELERRCENLPEVRFHHHVDDLAALMAKAGLAIGAGGSTIWERCCLFLPSVVISVADNQEATSRALGDAGAHLYLGSSADVTAATIAKAIERVCAEPGLVSDLAKTAGEIVDGLGAERVARVLLAAP